MNKFLATSSVIDWEHPDILQLAHKLAYEINFPEEIDCRHIFAEPLIQVIQASQEHTTWNEMLHNLPDLGRDYLAKF